MRRYAGAILVAWMLSGCTSFDSAPEAGGACGGSWGRNPGPAAVPGVQGAYGEKIPMVAPYSSAPPSAWAAQAMMSRSVPLDMVQMNGACRPGMPCPPGPGMMTGMPGSSLPPIMIPKDGILSPPGVPFAPGMPSGGSVNPTSFLPGSGPADPNVIQANIPPGSNLSGGIQLAQAQAAAANGQIRFPVSRTQIRFVRPSGMRISWITQGPDGKPIYSTNPIEAPGRYNFAQGAIYRLKLSNIEGRPGLEVYPTMEVVPCNPKTEAFLSHSAVPVEFTSEDFKQISEGNYVVKVIYLPDPQYQDIAGTGTDEILSTRLEPGADPIQEALRRGSILVVIRMGNVDQEAPNTPGLQAPPAGNRDLPPMPPAMNFGPGLPPRPGMQVPFGMTPPGMPPGIMPPGPFPGARGPLPGLPSTGPAMPPAPFSPSPGPGVPPPNTLAPPSVLGGIGDLNLNKEPAPPNSAGVPGPAPELTPPAIPPATPTIPEVPPAKEPAKASPAVPMPELPSGKMSPTKETPDGPGPMEPPPAKASGTPPPLPPLPPPSAVPPAAKGAANVPPLPGAAPPALPVPEGPPAIPAFPPASGHILAPPTGPSSALPTPAETATQASGATK